MAVKCVAIILWVVLMAQAAKAKAEDFYPAEHQETQQLDQMTAVR